MRTLLSILALLPAATAADDEPTPKKPPERVIKSDREWAKILTREQYMVCRMKATEPAFTGKYVHNHARGAYLCVCCGAELFDSRAKFESGTGWPSFWRPNALDRIATAPDFSGGEPRVEVECARCGSHLGHVFNDGPPPTGLRYCINSVSLKFVKAGATPTTRRAPKKKAAAKSKKATDPAAKAPAAAEPPTDPAEADPKAPAPDARARTKSRRNVPAGTRPRAPAGRSGD